MFAVKFHLSPDEGSAAAPTAAPASTPINTSSGTQPIVSTADLFKGFEEKLWSNDAQGMAVEHDDPAWGQQTMGEEGAEDIDANSASPELDQLEAQKAEAAAKEEDDGLPLYTFKAEIGDETYEAVIENPEQLDHYLKRAMVAPKIFAENKQLRTEMKQYQEKAGIADEFDRMHKESPFELLNMIVDDLSHDELREWGGELMNHLDKTAEHQEFYKAQREAAQIKKVWAQQQEQQERLNQQRIAQIEEQNANEVRNWKKSEFNKWSAKIPKEHHDVLNDMIEGQLMYAHAKASEGVDVDLAHLTSRLYKFANTIAGTQKSIQAKVGKATQDARQQSTQKLQAATSQSRVPMAQNSAGGPQFKDTNQLFDFLSRKVGTGEIKLKG